MKITKDKQDPNIRIWVGTCRVCKSEAEAIQNELKNIMYDGRDGYTFSWEKCPVCQAGGNKGYGGMLFYPKPKEYNE